MIRITFGQNRLFATAVLATTVLAAPGARAVDLPAYSVSIHSTTFNDGPVTTGFKFTAVNTVPVTALGFHDDQLNGLNFAHQVGLYSSSGTLLALVTVPAGIAAPLVGEHRYTSLSSAFVLQAGTQYVLAAHTDVTDGYSYIGPAGTRTVDPQITIDPGLGVYNYGANLAFPQSTFAAVGFYSTPNMLLTAPVPEPGTWAMLCGGLAALAGAVRQGRGPLAGKS